jgi:hypothetical protein
MKVHQLLENRGESLMDFLDYLSSPDAAIPEQFRKDFEDLGEKLFSEGWEYFMGNFTTDDFTIRLPTNSWPQKRNGTVRVTYLSPQGPNAEDYYRATEVTAFLRLVLKEVKELWR